MPECLIKGELMTLVGLYVTGIVSKAQADLTTMSIGVHDSSGCARHRSVYVCITVKGSRVCDVSLIKCIVVHLLIASFIS